MALVDEATVSLWSAALAGDVASARSALAEGATVDVVDDRGVGPLAIAARRADLAIVDLLLSAGAPIGGPTPERPARFTIAAVEHRVEVDGGAVSWRSGFRLVPDTAPVTRGELPLLAACLHHFLDGYHDDEEAHPLAMARAASVVLRLIAAGARVEADRGEAVERAVCGASRMDSDTLAALLSAGAPIGARGKLPERGSTALRWASQFGDLASVEMLLAQGADPRAADDLGATPLAACIVRASEHAEVAARLLAFGALPDEGVVPESPAMRPLTHALAQKARFLPEVVALLVSSGASRKGLKARRRAEIAGALGDLETVSALGPKLSEEERASVLYYAAALDRLEVVTALSASVTEDAIARALTEAAARGHSRVADCLATKLGPSRIAVDALESACAGGHLATVRLLADRGAPLDRPEWAPRAPLCIAALGGHVACVAELLRRGALIAPLVEGNLHASPIGAAVRRGDGALLDVILAQEIDSFVDHGRRSRLIEVAREKGQAAMAARLEALAGSGQASDVSSHLRDPSRRMAHQLLQPLRTVAHGLEASACETARRVNSSAFARRAFQSAGGSRSSLG